MGSVDEAWVEFAGEALPSEPGLNQAEEMRMAFTAGWFGALSELAKHPREQKTPSMADRWSHLYRDARAAMKREVSLLFTRREKEELHR